MTDKEYAKQKARIQKYLDKWQGPCGFNWWSVTHEFLRLTDEQQPGGAGITSVQWEYRNAYIKWIIPHIINLTEDDLEECVLHELCHLLIGSIQDYSEKMADRTELAVTNIQRALMWAAEEIKNAQV